MAFLIEEFHWNFYRAKLRGHGHSPLIQAENNAASPHSKTLQPFGGEPKIQTIRNRITKMPEQPSNNQNENAMDSSTLKSNSAKGSNSTPVRASSQNRGPIRKIFEFLASVKLTVVILITAVFMIWVATLQQVEHDIWHLKKMHFQSVAVRIPLYTFFPTVWFPETRDYLQNTEPVLNWFSASTDNVESGSENDPTQVFKKNSIAVLLPSGITVIVAMLVNLFAAHSLRFRIQAKGTRLVSGLAILLVGLVVCYGVVNLGKVSYSGGAPVDPNVKDGFRQVVYDSLWKCIVFGIGFLGVLSAFFGLKWQKTSFNFAMVLYALCGVMIATCVFILTSNEERLNDAGMRILWQICQCSFASSIVLGGLWLIFKRKAGMVLLHAGLILLLFNEIWVTLAHQEQSISGAEGSVQTYAIDIRAAELAFIDRSDEEFDRIVTLPLEQLVESYSQNQGTDKVERIEVPKTDLEIEILQCYVNSKFPSQEDLKNHPSLKAFTGLKSSQGFGSMVVPVPIPPVSGTDQGVNMASVLVRVFEKGSGKEFGTFWASQLRDGRNAPVLQIPNVIQTEENKYVMTVWFERTYKDYDVQIGDVQALYYPGTKKPRHFETNFKIVNHQSDQVSQHRIWMNNPLRYGDETFYQSDYRDMGDTEVTGLQLVWNRGWMIPYLCCAMVGVGMLAHFVPNLLKYIDKSSQPRPSAISAGLERIKEKQSGQTTKWNLKELTYTGLIWGFCVLMLLGRARPTSPKIEQLNLSGFEKVPISLGGRILPLGSMVRNTLRNTMGLETVESKERSIFGSFKKHPATVFLAKLISNHKDAMNYPCIKVDNRQLLDQMKLRQHPGFRFSLAELKPYRGGDLEKTLLIQKSLNEFIDKEAKYRNAYEKSLVDFLGHHRSIEYLKKGVGGLEGERYLKKFTNAADSNSSGASPRVIPARKFNQPWFPLNVAQFLMELEELAAIRKVKNINDLYLVSLEQTVLPRVAEFDYENQVEMARKSPNPEQALKKILPVDDPKRLNALTDRFSSLSTKERLRTLTAFLNLLNYGVDSDFQSRHRKAFRAIIPNGDSETSVEDVFLTDVQKTFVGDWENMLQAIKDQDQQKLDAAVTSLNDHLRQEFVLDPAKFKEQKLLAKEENRDPPFDVESSLARANVESQFVKWQPTYLAKVLYFMVGILATIGAIAKSKLFTRSAFWIFTTGFLVHTFALLIRLYISQNALITSIYTSAFAIGWGLGFLFLTMYFLTKRPVALILGGNAAFFALHVAYGLSTSGDTFVLVQAVLDTKFWLWTHVIIIAIGYLLTFVAGFLAIGFAFIAIINGSSREKLKAEMDLTYGILCAATLASFIGTVLGGLWADDSWGRFWGWDTKENGAAMIVLWNAAILHARWCGMIRIRGLIFMLSIGNMVTCWSWFAVNELGIGLHSYGFTKGALFWLSIYWAAQFVAGLIAFIPSEALGKNSRRSGNRATATT